MNTQTGLHLCCSHATISQFFSQHAPSIMSKLCIYCYIDVYLIKKIKFKEECTVKLAVAATSIKRDPPLSGHFRAPPNDFECKCTFI